MIERITERDVFKIGFLRGFIGLSQGVGPSQRMVVKKGVLCLFPFCVLKGRWGLNGEDLVGPCCLPLI
jgi:hypothetical protein